MQVRLYARLRQIAETRELELSVGVEQTVGDVLRELVVRFPGLNEAIWHADGSLVGHVAVLLNGRDIRHLTGLDTPICMTDQMDIFPPVGGGAGQDKLTPIKLKFAGDLHGRVGKSQTEFIFKGNTLRELIPVVSKECELSDLLMAGDAPKPYLQMVINGRPWYTVGGWEAQIPDGATVVLFLFGGVLSPVPLPPETTLQYLSSLPE